MSTATESYALKENHAEHSAALSAVGETEADSRVDSIRNDAVDVDASKSRRTAGDVV